MSGGQLNADAEQYLRAAGMNVAPPVITPDPLVDGAVPIEQLLRVLGLAANAGDPQDNTESAEEHAKRDAKTTEAAAKFPAQDEAAAGELNGVAGQMAQQVPQMASGIAGALAGAVGGALQPVAQLPQQLAQGVQQAMQSGLGVMQQAGGTAQLDGASLADLPLDEFDSGADDFGGIGADLGGGGGATGGGLGGTTPTAFLGPPPVPSASTWPSSAAVNLPPQPSAATVPPAAAGGMSGVPVVPPGAMHGAVGADKDAKAETKRLTIPPVKNGAPVQGRVTTPPPVPQVTKRIDGKVVATKRIMVPGSAALGEECAENPDRP